MLSHRVIPVLLHRNGALVKGKKYNPSRVVGNAMSAALTHQMRSVDELIMLDVSATIENRGPNIAHVAALTAKCFMPLTVGGGVRNLDDVSDLWSAGADTISIETLLWTDPAMVERMSNRFGRQAITGSVSYHEHTQQCAILETVLPISAHDHAKRAEELGCGQILLSCRDRDGMMDGYDLRTLEQVCNVVDVPVIAMGGAGTYVHMREAIAAGASAVAAGAMWQFTDRTPRDAAQYLAEHDVEVRV